MRRLAAVASRLDGAPIGERRLEFEMEFAQGYSGTGNYAFVTHAFADANKGAVGVIQVGQPAHMASH